MNRAVATFVCVPETEQEGVDPWQAPFQPAKVDVSPGRALSETTELAGRVAWHTVLVQVSAVPPAEREPLPLPERRMQSLAAGAVPVTAAPAFREPVVAAFPA